MDRTVKVHLNPTPEQARILKQTLDEHTACFNAVCQEGFTTACSNGVELHKRTYYPLRRAFPDLPAQLVCAARVKATEAVKSALTWKTKKERAYPKIVAKAKKQGKEPPPFKPVKCPHSDCACIRYDARSYWVKWGTMTCSLATVNGRIELPFTVPAHLGQYIGQKPCSADLCYRKGRFTLHIVVSLPEPQVAPNEEVIGVDLGLNRPAVTSTRLFLGERRWKEQERRTFRLKRKLQKKGTKSATRHLRKLVGKQFRRHRDHDHVLSKRIVQNAPAGSTIVLENLKHIRETSKIGRGKGKQTENKRRLHSWSFAQLYGFIEYKAAARGIRVEKIDPRHTSQTCSKCGHQARNNRRSQSLFLCRKCGYQLNADYNAAKNIREKYVASLVQDGTPVLSGPTCQAASRLDSSESGASPADSAWGSLDFLEFHDDERCSNAEEAPSAEHEGLANIASPRVELIWIAEYPGVPVSRPNQSQNVAPGFNRYLSYASGLGGIANGGLRWAVQSETFPDHIFFDGIDSEILRVEKAQIDKRSKAIGRRFVPGDQQINAQRHCLLAGQT
jgi:putative transposase